MPLSTPASDLNETVERSTPEQAQLSHERQLTYATYGEPHGETVLFLHGTPGSRDLGKLLEPAASELDYRVLAPDRPGYGHSSPWPSRSIRDGEEVVSTVLDDAGAESARIVAFSGGSAPALAAAESLPDRITRLDIVSSATPPGVSEATPDVQRVLNRLATTTPALLKGMFRVQAWLAARNPSLIVDQYTTEEGASALPDHVVTIVSEDFRTAFSQHRTGAVTEFQNMAKDWGLDYDEINIPVQFWHGGADTNVPPEDACRFAEEIPTADIRVLDGSDHLNALLESLPMILEGTQ